MSTPIAAPRRLSLKSALRSAALIVLVAWTGQAALANGEAAKHSPVGTTATALVRAAIQTEDFEAVVSIEDGRVWLYLDRFSTNEPVANARIEAEWRGAPIGVKELAPGSYELLEPALTAPGEHALSLSIVAGVSADLLTLTLSVPQPEAAAVPTRSWRRWAAWGAAALLTLTALALLVRRRTGRSNASRKGTA